MRRIAAVVLYYDRGDDVAGTIRSLRAQTRPVDELLLVDNCSPHHPVDPRWFDDGPVRVERPLQNLGYAGGMNLGVRRLGEGADALLLLTHDTRLHPACVERLAEVLDTSPGVAAVGPLIGRREAPEVVYSAGGVLVGAARRPDHLASPGEMGAWPDDEVRIPAWLDGCALLVRAAAFDAVGGLDERLFLYLEDVDLCGRLTAAGWQIALHTGARAWEQSAGTDPASYLANRLRLHRRHHGWRVVVTAVAVELARVVKRATSADPQRRASGWTAARQLWAFVRRPAFPDRMPEHASDDA